MVFDLLVLIGFTLADYSTGRSLKPWWGTRSIYLTGPVWAFWIAMAALVLHRNAIGWSAVVAGWALWRSLFGWSTFGGSMDVQTLKQLFAELARNVLSSVFPAVALVFGLHIHWEVAVVAMFGFAVLATSAACWYGWEVEHGHDVGPEVDAIHGMIFGALAVIAAGGL